MDTGTAVGIAVGLFGLVLGLGVPIAIWRGTFSRWVAIRPDGATRSMVCDAETLRARLLALNDANQPFSYIPAPDGTVVATWRIADATWQQFFARFHATDTYRATLAFAPEHREVRALEQRSSTRSGPGEQSASAFQGIVLFERSHYREWALTGRLPLVPREAVSFDFDVRRIKGPLIDTTLACGWTWVPVVMRSHLTAHRRLA